MSKKRNIEQVNFINQASSPKYYIMTSESGYSSAEYNYPYNISSRSDSIVVSEQKETSGKPIPAKDNGMLK